MIYVVKTSFDVAIDDVLSVVYYLLTSASSPASNPAEGASSFGGITFGGD